MSKIDLKKYIGEIPNFPKPGILFYDISPLLASPEGWKEAVKQVALLVKEMQPDILVGLESRGFLVSSAVSNELNLGFAMIRKKGKLPGKVISYSYDLEYGSDTMEIRENIIKPNQKVVILDDLLATGGTLNASFELLKTIGANPVGAVCIMELVALKGREKLNFPVETILKF
jgi:adenine phosphoribosyltransferase